MQNFHFMVFQRYWSRIQDFREFIRRIPIVCRHASFLSSLPDSVFWKHLFSNIAFVFSKFILSNLVNPGVKNNGCRRSLTFPLTLEIIKMKTCRFLGKWKFSSTHEIPLIINLLHLWPFKGAQTSAAGGLSPTGKSPRFFCACCCRWALDLD